MTMTPASDLDNLARATTFTSAWWAAVARALDALEDRLRLGQGGGRASAGEVPNEELRLARDRARLIERAQRLRRLVADVAADPRYGPAVSGELALLADAEANHRRRSVNLFWDSAALYLSRTGTP